MNFWSSGFGSKSEQKLGHARFPVCDQACARFCFRKLKIRSISDEKCVFLYFDPGSIKNRFLDSLRPVSEIWARFPVCDQASARFCFRKLKIRSLCDEKCAFLYFDPGSIKNRFLDSLRPVSEIRAQFHVFDQASARFCFRKLKIRSLCDEKCGFLNFDPGSIKNRFLDSLRPVSEIWAQFPVCDQASASFASESWNQKYIRWKMCIFVFWPWVNRKPVSGLVKTG